MHISCKRIVYIKMQAQNVMNIVVHAIQYMRMLNVVRFYFIGICLVSNSGGHPLYMFSIVSLYDGWASPTQAFHSISSETSFHARLF